MKSFSATIHSILGKNTHEVIERKEMDKLITYAKSIVTQEDVIPPILQLQPKENSVDYKTEVTNYIKTYLALEELILNRKSAIIGKVYTKESLHKAVREEINISALPEIFCMIFLPEKEQLFSFFSNYSQNFAIYLINQIGSNRVEEIIRNIPKLSIFPQTTSHGINFNPIKQALLHMSSEEITAYFKAINVTLFQETSSSFGLKTAEEITQTTYALIKRLYGYNFIFHYLSILPDTVMEKERQEYETLTLLEERSLARREDITSDTTQQFKPIYLRNSV